MIFLTEPRETKLFRNYHIYIHDTSCAADASHELWSLTAEAACDEDSGDKVRRASSGAARNLRLIFMEAFAWSLSQTLWHNYLLSQWLYLLSPDTRVVGLAEGAQGVCKLGAVFFFGLAVDAWPRNRMLLACAALGLVAHAVVALLVATSRWQLEAWYAALGLYAIYGVGQQVLTDAVFADSVATGERAGP